jgi:superfamily II DNA or RNA helicase
MKYYGLSTDEQLDLGGIQVVNGDYDERQLKNACDRPELIARVVEEWQRLTPGKRTIAFCVDVGHARHIAEAFEQAGIPAACVDGNTPIKKRHQLYKAIASGEIQVLSSCNVLSIGFDVPAIEVGLLLRPTMSYALHIQQIGRVMRISPQTGKANGIILDQAGNLQRMGFPEDVTHYELPVGSSGKEQKQKSGTGGAPKKPCPQCGTCVNTFVMNCPECGHDWSADRPIYTHDLVELMTRDQISQVSDEPTRYRIYQGMRQQMFRRGMVPDLARQRYFDCFQTWPGPDWSAGAIFGRAPSPDDKELYKQYLGRLAGQKGKPFNWMVEEFQKEFGPDSW